MLHIGINGCCGRMGLVVGRLASADPALRIAAALERAGHPSLGLDYGELLGGPKSGVAVSERLDGRARALVDFSAPDAVVARIPDCLRGRVAMVVGTTGLEPRHLRELKRAAARVPVLVSTNMSFGVNLLFKMAEELARALGPDADVEIVETHHRMKKDAPSGTALTLAERISAARGGAAVVHGRSGQVGERPRGQIGVHAVRGGDVVGEHTVSFISEGESLEVSHRARTREIFARGALKIAPALARRRPGLYSFRDLL
jgi:4-hydroxy-tetrahydrodipicolinate reductase